MFGFIKNMFIVLLSVYTIGCFAASLAPNYKEPIKCVSLNSKPCQTRPAIVNINSDETAENPVTVSVNKCGGSCNNIDDPYACVCVLNKVK